MEWIDEEEQRRKKTASIAVSASAAAISPQVAGPFTLDDFMGQWLHPNWSHVSCVAKMHLSPEQVPPSPPPLHKSRTHVVCSAKIGERAPFKCRYLSPRLLRKAKSFFLFSSTVDRSRRAKQLRGNWRFRALPWQTQMQASCLYILIT
jgi:hypothetical protein